MNMTRKCYVVSGDKGTPEFDMVLELADLLGVSPSEVIRLLVNDNYGSAGDGEK